jgi:uncharacterized membrane protein YfhO
MLNHDFLELMHKEKLYRKNRKKKTIKRVILAFLFLIVLFLIALLLEDKLKQKFEILGSEETNRTESDIKVPLVLKEVEPIVKEVEKNITKTAPKIQKVVENKSEID